MDDRIEEIKRMERELARLKSSIKQDTNEEKSSDDLNVASDIISTGKVRIYNISILKEQHKLKTSTRCCGSKLFISNSQKLIFNIDVSGQRAGTVTTFDTYYAECNYEGHIKNGFHRVRNNIASYIFDKVHPTHDIHFSVNNCYVIMNVDSTWSCFCEKDGCFNLTCCIFGAFTFFICYLPYFLLNYCYDKTHILELEIVE